MTPRLQLAIVIAILLGVAAFALIDRVWLDPGGRGFAGEANDKCRGHDGVALIRAYEGTIICRDGWAAE